MQSPDAEPVESSALARSRLIAGGSVVGVLLVAAVGSLFDPGRRLESIAPTVGLLGIVSPVIAYRLYLWEKERIPPQADSTRRARGFVRATLIAVSVSESIALSGVVAYVLSGRIVALLGVLTMVLLVGAIWPTSERLESFSSAD